jgi:hypothetical protein
MAFIRYGYPNPSGALVAKPVDFGCRKQADDTIGDPDESLGKMYARDVRCSSPPVNSA